jgi:transposase InsO family protein
VNWLERLCRLHTAAAAIEPRRGPAAQREQRELERLARVEAVHFGHWAEDRGVSQREIAGQLGIAARTLRQWEHAWEHGDLRVVPLGRPVVRSPRPRRTEVLELLQEVGPGIGLPSLQAHFAELARAELRDLLHRYRRVWVKRYHQTLHVLHWQRPGTVWAMDYAVPPVPLEGGTALLAIRDLASCQQLLWQPVTAATAAAAVEALTMLFTIHGAPLVLKTDNGSPFCAAETERLLEQWQVKALFSPPRLPSYNGSIEAGIGSLKTRTALHATRHDHPEWWSWDDVEAARLEANALTRPRGPHGATPDEMWAGRNLLTEEYWATFAEEVARHEREVRAMAGIPQTGELERKDQTAVDRKAITRALVAYDLLLFRRRRIPLPISRLKVARIM